MPKRYNREDKYFFNNYNTKLDKNAEAQFQTWLMDQSLFTGRDFTKNLQDYDLRGFWQSLGQSGINVNRGHGPDTFKKPNHPSFSIDSQYSGSQLPNGEPAVGGIWLGNSYAPSSQMLQYTHDPQSMKEYFNRYEPNINLVMPP